MGKVKEPGHSNIGGLPWFIYNREGPVKYIGLEKSSGPKSKNFWPRPIDFIKPQIKIVISLGKFLSVGSPTADSYRLHPVRNPTPLRRTRSWFPLVPKTPTPIATLPTNESNNITEKPLPQ